MRVRTAEETIAVALAITVSLVAFAIETRAWLPGASAFLMFVLRFGLQPPEGDRLSYARRTLLVVCAWAGVACLIWGIGVRVAQWPGYRP